MTTNETITQKLSNNNNEDFSSPTTQSSRSKSSSSNLNSNNNNNNNGLVLHNSSSQNSTPILNNNNNNSNSNRKKRLFNSENLNHHYVQIKDLEKKDDFKNINIINSSSSSSSNSKKMIDLNKDDGYVDEYEDYYGGCSTNGVDEEEDDDENACKEDLNNTEDEPIDPRIQIELERLNKSSADVNHLENELDETRSIFVSTKNRQSQRIEYLQKKLGNCIIKSKPYYEALQAKERLQKETQKAVQEFQKAISNFKTAKETLSVAEQNLSTNGISDVWQEYLSETITKINNYKKLADQAEEYHRNKTLEYQMCEKRLQFLEKDLRRNIEKSQPYYEEKMRWNLQMEAQRNRIYDLEKALKDAKRVYSEAMNNLRIINEEIHLSRRTRKMRLKKREPCVDAEKSNEYQETKINENTNSKERRPSLHISKSLDDLIKILDSTDETTSECTSVDAMSNNSKKSSVINSQNPNEYYSFGSEITTMHSDESTSSRSSSPNQYTSSSVNNLNTIDNYDNDLDIIDDHMRPSQSMGLINTRVLSGESSEKLKISKERKKSSTSSQNNTTQDSGKFSLGTNNDKSTDSVTASIINANPKINNSLVVKIDSRLPTKPPRSTPTSRKVSNEVKQETPLLSNLLLYNSVLTKATNNRIANSTNNDDSNKPRSSSFKF